MSTVDNVKIVRQAKIAADNEGNKNHKLDTIEEVSLFADKLEEKGISNARKIINGYNTNPVYFETKFQLNGTGKDDSVEAAIASALNKNSYANNAELIKEEANDIVNGIEDGIGESWFFGLFNDYDKLNQKVGAINHENVLEVLNADYNGSGSNIIAGITNFANQEHLDTYGKTIITALVNLAKTKGIDVSDIVEEEGDKFSVGTAISGIEVGSNPTDKKHIEKVIYTLKERIENSMKMITDPEKAQDDMSATFATLLNANDRNQNGYIDGEEIFAFKAWCAKLGISVNEMIMNINEKTENNEELTEVLSRYIHYWHAITFGHDLGVQVMRSYEYEGYPSAESEDNAYENIRRLSEGIKGARVWNKEYGFGTYIKYPIPLLSTTI